MSSAGRRTIAESILFLIVLFPPSIMAQAGDNNGRINLVDGYDFANA